MATVSDALNALGINEWVLRGEPTSAEEFASFNDGRSSSPNNQG